MTIQTVTDAIRYVGVDDNTLALFENQYPVQPMGVSYNSYVILDEKIAVMDSVDARAAEEWLSNVAQVLEGRIVGRPYAGGWRKRYAFLGLAPAALSAGADGTLAGGDGSV